MYDPSPAVCLLAGFNSVLFVLSDETDMDVITEAMESFIDAFQTQLAPAAVQIVTRLVRWFSSHPWISIHS